MLSELFSKVTPELNDLVSQLKNIFPIVSIAMLVWSKTSANAETDENEAKKKNKRAKTIIFSVPMLAFSVIIINMMWSKWG